MATLIKNGQPFEIKVIGTEDLIIDEGFKNVVHSILGDREIYEYVGKSDQKISLTLYLKNKDEYDSLISFFKDGKPFAFRVADFDGIYNLNGSVKARKSFYDGSYSAEVNFTDAKNLQSIGGLFQSNELLGPFQSSSSKPEWIESISEYANKTIDFEGNPIDSEGNTIIDFVGNTNSLIAAYTGKFQEYSVAINRVASGIGSSSTIITSPISSVRNSASSIIGGVSSVISSIGTAINAIKQVPNQTSNMIDSILDIGEQLSNIFNNDDKQQQSKQTTSFLIDVGDVLIDVAELPVDSKTVIEDPYSVTFDPELTISSIGNRNIDMLSILMLSSILLAIYDESSQVTDWNKDDLDRIMKQTNILFEYIMSKELSSDVRSNLIYARNSFFRSFKSLYDNSLSFVTVEVREPSFLTDVVYSVNGNFDYYLETKKFNNVLGSIVQGNIKVLKNE